MTAPTRRRVALAMVTASVLLGACGIPLDDQPRLPAPEARRGSVPTTTAPSGGSAAFAFLTLADAVVPVSAEVGDGSLDARMNALLAAEPTGGAASSIPPGTRLLSIERNASIVTVDLSEEFDNLQGTARRLAAAEVVFTLTEVRGVEDILFKVDGRLTRVDSPLAGDTDRVRACDYVGLLPTPEQAAVLSLDDDATEHAADRRSSLVRRCPSATETPGD